MNDHAKTAERLGRSRGCDFSRRTAPNRPIRDEPGSSPEEGEGARDYPERCHPNRKRVPLTDAQRALVSRHLPLARSMAQKAESPITSQQELQAEAYSALTEAAQTFDPYRGVNFAAYARLRIQGAIKDYYRFVLQGSRRGSRSLAPVFCRLHPTDESRFRVFGRHEDPPVGAELEALDEFEAALRHLPRTHAAVCRSIYLEGRNQEETAAALGYSKGYLSRLHGASLAWLADYYEQSAAA